MALLNLRTQPRTDTGISPFEMLYGMPYDLEILVEHPKVEEKVLQEYIIELMKRRQELIKKGLVVQRPPLERVLPDPSLGRTLSHFTYYRHRSLDGRTRMDAC